MAVSGFVVLLPLVAESLVLPLVPALPLVAESLVLQVLPLVAGSLVLQVVLQAVLRVAWVLRQLACLLLSRYQLDHLLLPLLFLVRVLLLCFLRVLAEVGA